MGAIETIRWLGDCLHEDRARRGVRDFTSGKVEVRKFMAGTELLATDDLPSEVVGAAYGKRMSQKLATHGRRRETVYGTLFLTGRFMNKTWCAPVLLYPGLVTRDGVGEIEVAHCKLNPVLRDELDFDEEFEGDFESLLGDGILTVRLVRRLGARMQKSLPGLDVSPLGEFPHLARAGDLDERKSKKGLALVSASAFGLLERSRGVAGVLHELKELAESPSSWSRPLEVFMGLRKEKTAESTNRIDQVPAVLSGAQERIVRSARKNAVTLCHGPPGTGKSFTIAAIAIDHIARGESVLIASEKDHAVDVAADKIRVMMGGAEVTVRAGRSGYLRKLKRFIEDCLSGLQTANQPDKAWWGKERKELEKTVRELAKRESWLAGEINQALAHGELIADPNPGWWKRFLQRRVAKKVRRRPLLMEVSGELERAHERRMRQARKLLRLRRSIQLHDALGIRGVREHFRIFLSGLRKRKPGDQEKMLKSVKWEALLSTLPVWVARLSDVHRVLPLERHLFDVAIIDESTQCDLASVLPLLQRAKRVVVAGDQRQLRHVSFLSRRRMESLARNHKVAKRDQEQFDYRDRSLMDLAIDRVLDARQIGFLNEHFRSRRSIIAFSNEQFYSGRISVMTERPWESDEGALEVEYCGGTRDANGVNEKEIERIIVYLKELLKVRSGGPPKLCPSLGILSPFRNQVETIRAHLEEKLTPKEFSALTRDHRLLLGTAYSFQGEERDFMLLSFAVDRKTPANVYRFLERADIFNVSITRARSYQRIFSSVTVSEMPRKGILAKYLGSIGRPPGRRKKIPALPDQFADELKAALAPHRCTVRRSVTVAGVPVDLLLTREGRSLGIDLIGHPGELCEAIEEKRIRVLARAGFVLLPLGLAEWRTRKVDVLREVLKRL